jgi:hypothetical protein
MPETARAPFITPANRAHGQRLVAAIGSGSILVTGETMVGKSFLVRHWLGAVDPARYLILELEQLGSRSPLRQVADHLGVGGDLADDVLAAHCCAALEDGREMTVVVDSAERLPEWVWQQLLVLHQTVAGVHFLWIGRLDIKQRMEVVHYRPLVAAIVCRVHLLAYAADESTQYCCEYLARTAPQVGLPPEGHAAVYGFALGYIPNTERVLDEAVALAQSRGHDEIEPLMVRVAIDALRGTAEWRPPGAVQRRGCALRATALVVAGLAALVSGIAILTHFAG